MGFDAKPFGELGEALDFGELLKAVRVAATPEEQESANEAISIVTTRLRSNGLASRGRPCEEQHRNGDEPVQDSEPPSLSRSSRQARVLRSVDSSRQVLATSLLLFWRRWDSSRSRGSRPRAC